MLISGGGLKGGRFSLFQIESGLNDVEGMAIKCPLRFCYKKIRVHYYIIKGEAICFDRWVQTTPKFFIFVFFYPPYLISSNIESSSHFSHGFKQKVNYVFDVNLLGIYRV